MNEQKSDPSQPSDVIPEEENIVEGLEKVQQIAKQESLEATPVSDLVEQEEKAFAGKNEDSALMVQFAEHEEKIKNLQLQNDFLQLQNDKLELQNKLLKHKNEEEILLDDARRNYTKGLFILTISWLSIVVICVLSTGLKFTNYNNPNCTENCVAFGLSDNVIIAFITSTTATVIGIFIIVAHWLFPTHRKEENTEKKEK